MGLKDYTEEELRNELGERVGKRTVKPKLLSTPDFSKVIQMTESHLNSIADGTYHEDSDDYHYIVEEVFKSLYGKNVYKWINANT